MNNPIPLPTKSKYLNLPKPRFIKKNKWNINLNVKLNTIICLEENTGKNSVT